MLVADVVRKGEQRSELSFDEYRAQVCSTGSHSKFVPLVNSLIEMLILIGYAYDSGRQGNCLQHCDD